MYLILLVKPRFFSGFQEKYIILCILKGEMPFKMHKIVFFSRKRIKPKKMCLSYLKYSDITRNTLIVLFGLIVISRASEYVFKRLRTPWFWPRFLFNLVGPGKQHDHCLKIMHDFTEKVGVTCLLF